jgi:hypothetical protein
MPEKPFDGTWAPYSVPREVFATRKIIGRPITLEDCFQAMVANHANKTIMASDRTLQNDVLRKWHLNKPLEEQSEETIAFIGRALGV